MNGRGQAQGRPRKGLGVRVDHKGLIPSVLAFYSFVKAGDGNHENDRFLWVAQMEMLQDCLKQRKGG